MNVLNVDLSVGVVNVNPVLVKMSFVQSVLK